MQNNGFVALAKPSEPVLTEAMDTFSGMSAAEISAVDVVLRCLLCERFSACETARALVQEPLMLVDYDQESRQ